MYRVYAIRQSTFGGKPIRVLAEQVGGDFWSKAEAEKVAKESGPETAIVHVGGVS